MKFLIAILTLSIMTGVCNSAPKNNIDKIQNQTDQNAKTGPTGIGPLQIGMSKDDVINLQESDGVYLTAPLSNYESKYYKPVAGIDKFSTKIILPNSSTPVNFVLSFSLNKLTEIEVDFENSPYLYEKLKDQIAEKYTQGVFKDGRVEEQCVYRNGANFKINSGSFGTTWTQVIGTSDAIETRAYTHKVDMCPSSLRYGSVGGVELKTLTIKKIERTSESNTKSLF